MAILIDNYGVSPYLRCYGALGLPDGDSTAIRYSLVSFPEPKALLCAKVFTERGANVEIFNWFRMINGQYIYLDDEREWKCM
jgi:hypothetical protein